MINRRQFVKIAILAPFALKLEAAENLGKNDTPLKEAFYYQNWITNRKRFGANFALGDVRFQMVNQAFAEPEKTLTEALFPWLCPALCNARRSHREKTVFPRSSKNP
jgi:hypothetical protein